MRNASQSTNRIINGEKKIKFFVLITKAAKLTQNQHTKKNENDFYFSGCSRDTVHGRASALAVSTSVWYHFKWVYLLINKSKGNYFFRLPCFLPNFGSVPASLSLSLRRTLPCAFFHVQCCRHIQETRVTHAWNVMELVKRKVFCTPRLVHTKDKLSSA